MYKNLSKEALGITGHQSELIELTLSHGFRGMDLDGAEFLQRVKASSLAHASRLLSSAKLRLGSFSLSLDVEAEEADLNKQLAAAMELAEAAAAVKCDRAVLLLAPGSDLRPYHENFELHRNRLKTLAAALDQHKVRLAVGVQAAGSLRAGKAFEFIHNYDALLVLLNMVGAANLGLHLDLWSWVVGGGRVEDLRKLGPGKVLSVTLSDLPADVSADQATLEQRLLPGEGGAIDSSAALIALAELGYDGPVSPQVDRSQLTVQNREQVVKLASQKLDEVWKAAGLSPADY